MKKLVALFLIAFSLSSFADYQLKSFRRFYLSASGSVTYGSDVSFSNRVISNDFDSVIFPIVYNNNVYFKVNTSNKVLTNPSQVYSFSTTPSVDRPITVVSNDVSFCVSLFSFAPKTYSLYLFCNAYYRSNPTSTSFTTFSGGLVGFYPRQVVQEILFSTNSVIVSSFLSQLVNINSSLSNISELVDVNAYTLSDILDNVSGYVGPLRSRPFTEQIEAFSKNMGIYDAYISPDQLQLYKDHYNSLADSDPLAAAHYADSILGSLNSAQSLLNLQRAISDVSPRTNDALDSLGQHLTDHLNDSVNQGFSASAHIQGATTNMLQRMTNDTAQIKQDLQAWRNDTTNRLERQWDGIKKIRDNTGETAAGVDNIVNHGVKIQGPIVVHQDSDARFNVSLSDANLSTINNNIASGAREAMRMWLEEWDAFKASQIPYMGRFSSFVESNTNLLSSIDSKLDYSFTNIFDSIYFALTNLDLVASTNSYMLLSDYADYINSSGLSDLLDVLDDDEYSDFKAAVDSIGHSDVADGYGRWWRYFTGLSTVQANSIFKLSNIFDAHEKLILELKRDHSDVADLSNGSVFSDILSRIPSQTDIDNKLSQLTNSIDSSGMARIQQLIPDLTNRLSSASELYNRDFHLPTDIQWVLIPGDSTLNTKERVIHINPSEHYTFFQVLHYGIAFSYCIVNILLLPKFLLLLVRLFDRVWNKSEKLIYNSTQS